MLSKNNTENNFFLFLFLILDLKFFPFFEDCCVTCELLQF